uniref:Galectin n=1 Tax=Parascaris univalens TaxID=6257 RepID=A0A915CA43_PARUN
MGSIFRKLFGAHTKKVTQKDSITGRNNSFPVPYLSKLEGNLLQPGQSLIIRGYIIGRNEFIINLTGGPKVEMDAENDTLDNRYLVLRANITQKRVFLNACIDGEWGREGSLKHKWSPGDEFDIRIRAHDKHFEIYIEHKLVAKFAYYVPISNISHIYINGDVELYTVSWEGKYYQIPYAADIPGNFYPSRKLYVSALTKKRAKQFTVDFHSGNDIAFRFNPRIVEKKIVRNTRCEDRWGAEEKETEAPFPFKKKRTFDLLVYCEENRFVFYVDDCLIGTYTHRMGPRGIDKLCIDGDIELQGVHLK